MYCETQEPYTPSDTELYMNDRQLAYFRHRLLEQKEELKAAIAQSRTRLQNIKSESSDSLDLSSTETKITMALSELGRCQKKLWLVRQALERIDEGTFGYCLLTGSEIGIKRLNALPCATLSVVAQEMLETTPQQSHYPESRFAFSNRYSLAGE
ncbi:MAG: hypothetical protein V1793_19185 [Pseudomonadota bacterium]